MPALIPTSFRGRVVWLGRVGDREASLRSEAVEAVEVTFAGFEGEMHGGITRPSCNRVTALHPKDTEIRNARQVAIASVEEMAETARAMGLDRLDPMLVGVSMLLEGLPDLSHLPPSSRLQGPDGTTLVVDMQNRPCNLPAAPIEEAAPGFGRRYKAAARGRRGVTASVERPGRLALGEVLRLFVPDQRAWLHIEEARGAGVPPATVGAV